jgi:hypothetical protein
MKVNTVCGIRSTPNSRCLSNRTDCILRKLTPCLTSSSAAGNAQALSRARSSMIQRSAETALEYRRYRGFWFDLGSHCSRIRRN